MPGGWSKEREVRKLSESGVVFEWDIPAAELPGIPSDVLVADGLVHARVRFGKERGVVAAWLTVRAPLRLICQRCMQTLDVPLEATSAVAIVERESDADAVPPDWETYLAQEGRLNIAALVAEEMLLAVPLVPLHPDSSCSVASIAEGPLTRGAQLAPLSGDVGDASPQSSVRPFANLRSLLNRGDESK